MSYSIDDGITETQERLEAYRTIADAYPDARLTGQFWEADVRPEDCDYIHVDEDKLIPGRLVKGKFVARRHSWGTPVLVVLHELREKQPDVYAAILKAVLR